MCLHDWRTAQLLPGSPGRVGTRITCSWVTAQTPSPAFQAVSEESVILVPEQLNMFNLSSQISLCEHSPDSVFVFQ